MGFSAHKTEYKNTQSFSGIVLDYLADDPQLREFYNYRPDKIGIAKAIEDRKKFPVDRTLLHDIVSAQYVGMPLSAAVQKNIDALKNENTFTICTAHQPNIFTGHLYFIYKIIHAIKVSNELIETASDNYFVPVYYMGSEDADLDELGEVQVNGKKYNWQTGQTGAVGRMKVDDALLQIISEIEGQISGESYGTELLKLLIDAYRKDVSIQDATFQFVHSLFNDFGLIILLPDNAKLKSAFSGIIRKELSEQFSSKAVAETVKQFPSKYKVQASGRNINLFYLDEGMRERIEATGTGYRVAHTKIEFSDEEMNALINDHPEKFSPNVILRPVFQEMILPNVAFIGGGGELAYWLELKKVFEASGAFFPVLVLRNSFTLISEDVAERLSSLGFQPDDIFRSEQSLLETIVRRHAAANIELKEEKEQLRELYEAIRKRASDVDVTLSGHVHALRTTAVHRIELLEKKMLKAEKKKYEAQQRQIKKIKDTVSPGNALQERVDNLIPFYAAYGPALLNSILEHSGTVEQQFTILTLNASSNNS